MLRHFVVSLKVISTRQKAISGSISLNKRLKEEKDLMALI